MRKLTALTTAVALTTLLWAPTSSAANPGITEPPEPPQAFCLHPVGAIICLGFALLAASSCGGGFSCDGVPPRGDPSVPPDPSGGPPGDGDGDQEGSSGGGDDED